MIYQKLIENSPEFEKAYEHKATLLMKLNRFKEAGYVFNNLLKINPEYSGAYAGLGVCFEKLGKQNFAQRCYRKFLTFNEISPQSDFISERFNRKIEKTANLKFAIVK